MILSKHAAISNISKGLLRLLTSDDPELWELANIHIQKLKEQNPEVLFALCKELSLVPLFVPPRNLYSRYEEIINSLRDFCYENDISCF